MLYNNNSNSNLVGITISVLQRSILVPLLFSIFIHDFIHVTDKLKCISFADDTTTYLNFDDFDPATRERDINSEFENILFNKISKVISVMYTLQNVLPEHILLNMLYNSLISSHLNYRLFVWEIIADRLKILHKEKQFV